MMRSLFVREEGDRLVLGSGLSAAWLDASGPLRLGPTPTPFGPLTVEVEADGGRAAVRWQAARRDRPPAIDIALPGCAPLTARKGQDSVTVRRERVGGSLAEVAR
jgi:hypothetical protein